MRFCLTASGWISSIAVIRSNIAVAVFMMVVAGFLTVNAVLAVILLKMVSVSQGVGCVQRLAAETGVLESVLAQP